MARLLILLGALGALTACAGQPSASPDSHLAQEQRACAEIGVAPGDSAYPSCVGTLEAALFGLDKIPAGE